ncbi:MAG: hypothetical protein AAF594_00675, partial [Bacteroidota bacterium]
LVIGIVLVGLAVVAAFEVLDRNYRQDEADGLLNRALAISTHAVYWKTKNDPFAGGDQSYLNLVPGGIEELALDSTNVRGRFAFTQATPNTLEVTGVSDRYPDVGVRVYIRNYDVDSSRVAFDGSLSL